jgi:ubiquinone/menaquinone biosynthesis C-methylase UbiE
VRLFASRLLLVSDSVPDKQHIIFRDVMGKYPPMMYDVMRHDVPGETKACLDLGCGSGAWIMDFARDFPNSTCVAVDLVPMQSIHMPQNCRSEVDDINLGMEHFYGDFDVVHGRLISSGIQDYAALIDQISRVLRPGGVISLMEFDFHMYDENKRRIEIDRTTLDGPAWPKWLGFVHDIAKSAGGSVDAATYLFDWVQDHPLYEDVVYQEYYLPVSRWVGDGGPLDRVGSMMSPDCQAFVDSSRPMLLSSGLSEDLVNQLQKNAYEALQTNRAREYARIQCVHARRVQIDPDL